MQLVNRRKWWRLWAFALLLLAGAGFRNLDINGTTTIGSAKVAMEKVSWTVPIDRPDQRDAANWRVAAQDGHRVDPAVNAAVNPAVKAAGVGPAHGAPPGVTSHSPDPLMTGPMPGMDGMPGMAPGASGQASENPLRGGLAIAGLVLLMVLVAGSIVIERRRRPPPSAADRSGPSTD
jgi:hypothetical protein